MKHLNKRAGVRYYIAEVDPTKAYYLNQYLQTGQDSLLRLVFRSWIAETAQWTNVDFFQKIQALATEKPSVGESQRSLPISGLPFPGSIYILKSCTDVGEHTTLTLPR